MGKKSVVIDDPDVLHSFYDDRETFEVDFNPQLVELDLSRAGEGIVVFRLRT